MPSPLVAATPRRRPDTPGRPARPGRYPPPAPSPPRRPPGRPTPVRPRRSPAPGWRPGRPAAVPRALPLRRSPAWRRILPWIDFWPEELPLVYAPPVPQGWTGTGVCGSPLPQVRAHWWGYQGSCGPWPGYANSCLAGQAISESSWRWTPTAKVRIRVGRYYDPNIFAWRHQILEAFCYPSPLPRPIPRSAPRPQYRLGVATPGPIRDAVGGRHLPHGRETEADLSAAQAYGYSTGVVIDARVDPDGYVRRSIRPLPVSPGRPSDPADREAKDARRGAAAVMQRILSGVSEGRDAIDAIWRSLPERRRRARAGDTAQQLVDLWTNIDEIDWVAAARNLAIEQAEDLLFGGLIREAKLRGLGPYLEAVNWLDSYIGPSFRSRDLRRAQRER